MGAAPSIITVPSTSISRDVETLKALCPSRFQLEKPPSYSDGTHHETMAIMTDKSVPLTIILAAIPVPAASRIASNRVTFVLPESEIRSMVNRCADMRLLNKPPQEQISENTVDNFQMAEFNLPGGAGVALVAPSMVNGSTARFELAKKLAESLTLSLPKGVARTASNRGLVVLGKGAAPLTPRQTPERRQSFGSGRRPSPLGDTQVRSMAPPQQQGGRLSESPRYTSPRRSASPSSRRRSVSPSKRKQQQQQQMELMDFPSFPSLKFNTLHLNAKYRGDFFPNARIPIPVETELFVGRMVFLLQSDETEDSFWKERIFAHKKPTRRLVLQVQGKFKYDPRGLVYAGFEASNDLRLGRMSKGLSGLLLKWAGEKNENLYYSFGDDKEKAKAVVPAHTFFDHVVVTPQKREPPSILEPFKEKHESKKLRCGCQQKPWTDDPTHPEDITSQDESQWVWNINDTYSMSWSTSNIDLPTWKLLNVPGHGDLGLRALIGTSVLRFVMYENLTPEDKGENHVTNYLRYAYAVQCKFLGSLGPKPGEEAAVGEKDETMLDWIKQQPASQTKPEDSSDEVDAEKENAAHADEERPKLAEKGNISKLESEDAATEDKAYPDGNEGCFTNKLDRRPKFSSFAFDSLATIDALCPAWIDMCASQGKYTRAYAFNVNDRTVFRTPQSFRDLIRVGNYMGATVVSDSAMDTLCSPRASKAERTRRLFGTMLEQSLAGKNADSLIRMMEFYSSKFLTRRVTSFPEKTRSPTATGGLVARALSDRHWIEEWVQIDGKTISFQHPESRKRHFEIKMDCVVGIRNLQQEEAPVIYNNYHFLAIETLGQTSYLMLASETDRSRCADAISKACARIKSKNEARNKAYQNLCLNSSRSELARKSTIWNCGDRLIMNHRQMAFKTPKPGEEFDAMYVVEATLRKAFEDGIEQDDVKLQEFLDNASRLKLVNANSLREEHRLAFFLNLYHVMVMHATLILGVTDSQPTLVKNFGCLSYQCSDDIFTISELEHCILRANMARLDPVVSSTNPKAPPAINSRLLRQTSPFKTIPPLSFSFPTPRSNFCFALQKPDFRLNFAINFGSPSTPAEVPFYSVETVWEQLEEAARLYLQNNVAIKQRKKEYVCVLPRLCQWYEADFGSTNYAVLKTLEPYLNQQERKILRSPDFLSYPISVKYLPFRFDCTKLDLKEEPFTTVTPSLSVETSSSVDSSAASSSEASSSVESSVASSAAESSVAESLAEESSVYSSQTMPMASSSVFTKGSILPFKLTLSDAPTVTETDDDVNSLLDFLMDDHLTI